MVLINLFKKDVPLRTNSAGIGPRFGPSALAGPIPAEFVRKGHLMYNIGRLHETSYSYVAILMRLRNPNLKIHLKGKAVPRQTSLPGFPARHPLKLPPLVKQWSVEWCQKAFKVSL